MWCFFFLLFFISANKFKIFGEYLEEIKINLNVLVIVGLKMNRFQDIGFYFLHKLFYTATSSGQKQGSEKAMEWKLLNIRC